MIHKKFSSIQYLQTVKILKSPKGVTGVYENQRWHGGHLVTQLRWRFVKLLCWLYDFCYSHHIWLCQIPVVKGNTQVAVSYMQHREPTLPKLSFLAAGT